MRLFSFFTPKKWFLAQFSDIGQRKVNEDCIGKWQNKQFILLAVADGLGGHEAGEVASQLIIKQLLKQTEQQQKKLAKQLEKTFQSIVEQAVAQTTQQLAQDKLTAHTTLACVLIDLKHSQFISAHIGDSRIYHFAEKQVLWRTKDHSVVQMLVEDQEIDEADMGKHPEQGILTRSISGKRPAKIRFSKITPFYKKQGLLVCSDGYWENIPVDEVSHFIQKPQNLLRDLKKQIKEAKKQGGKDCDNISVAVFFNEG